MIDVQTVLLVAVSALAVFLLIYIFYLKNRRKYSKARFAFFVVTTIVVVFSAGISIVFRISTPLFDLLLNYFGYNLSSYSPFLSLLCAIILTWIALHYVVKFGLAAIKSWEGPVTISVNELAKLNRDNDLLILAFSELKRFLRHEKDDIVSDVALGWQRNVPEAPDSPDLMNYCRSLLTSAFCEMRISDEGRRNLIEGWVGHIYIGNSNESCPLVVLCFNMEPTAEDCGRRLCSLHENGNPVLNNYIVAVCDVANRKLDRTLLDGKRKIHVYSTRALLEKDLSFSVYARDILWRFNETRVGGTDAKLSDTFVPAHVKKPGQARQPLRDVLDIWVTEATRRHLAITGEYGQGKSTAMLAYCADWADGYLNGQAGDKKIPILIELRGKSPSEESPEQFLADWNNRYRIPADKLYNLIQSGDAVLIFEGFDELKNAGREYDRHEHFNALWKFCYPGVKVIFTGRPNFFIDDKEKNRTLRVDSSFGAAGNAFTDLWELDRLNIEEIEAACCVYAGGIGAEIVGAAKNHSDFFQIVSRPSMLPVVATIWPEIKELKKAGHELTGALLIEKYLKATFERKDSEIRQQNSRWRQSKIADHLILPVEVRELYTMCVVWYMASHDARNTLSRCAMRDLIGRCHDVFMRLAKKKGVPFYIVRWSKEFEDRFREVERGDVLDVLTADVASGGIFVPDIAAGADNLRFPHKQFYEYYIAKSFWFIRTSPKSVWAQVIEQSEKTARPATLLLREPNAIRYAVEIGDRSLFPFFVHGKISAMFFYHYYDISYPLLEKVFGLNPIVGAIDLIKIINSFNENEEQKNGKLKMGLILSGKIVFSSILFILVYMMSNFNINVFIGNDHEYLSFFTIYSVVIFILFLAIIFSFLRYLIFPLSEEFVLLIYATGNLIKIDNAFGFFKILSYLKEKKFNIFCHKYWQKSNSTSKKYIVEPPA